MKRGSIFILVLSMFLASSALFVQSVIPDDVRGLYWNAEKTAKIKIYRAKNGKYYSKISHLTEPNGEDGLPKKDPFNPNEKLKSRARLGMIIMKSFEWDEEDKMWSGGTIYDPSSGKTYDGYMKFEGDKKDVLFLRGYVMGMTWLGKTSEWERIE